MLLEKIQPSNNCMIQGKKKVINLKSKQATSKPPAQPLAQPHKEGGVTFSRDDLPTQVASKELNLKTFQHGDVQMKSNPKLKPDTAAAAIQADES